MAREKSTIEYQNVSMRIPKELYSEYKKETVELMSLIINKNSLLKNIIIIFLQYLLLQVLHVKFFELKLNFYPL